MMDHIRKQSGAGEVKRLVLVCQEHRLVECHSVTTDEKQQQFLKCKSTRFDEQGLTHLLVLDTHGFRHRQMNWSVTDRSCGVDGPFPKCQH